MLVWSFDAAVLNCDEWFARVSVCVKLITVVDVRCTQHVFYPCVGVAAAQATQAAFQAEIAAVSARAAVVCAFVVLNSLACSFVNVMLCAHRLFPALLSALLWLLRL